MGLERLKEALEANEWANGADSASELEFDDKAEAGFELETAEMESEVLELKAAISASNAKPLSKGTPDEGTADEGADRDGDGSHLQIEELEAMMLKMQAIKGTIQPFSEFSGRKPF